MKRVQQYSDANNTTTSVNGAWKPVKPLQEGFEFVGDDYFNAVDPITATIEAGGKVAESVGDIATARSNRKVAELKVAEIGGKRTAQLKACEENKAFKKFGDLKYRRNRIKECQAEVKKRLDFEEAEQMDIIRRSLDIEQGKVSNQRISEVSKTNYIWIGVGIVALIGVYLLVKKR